MLLNRLQSVHNTGNQRKSERMSAIALPPHPRRREQAVRQPGEVGHENGLRALLRSDPLDEPICGPHGPSSRRPANGNGDGAGRHAGDLAEQAATVQTVGAEPLRDGEHDLSVRHRREQCRVQPLGPDRSPLGMTARAEVPALAGERKQVLVHTRIAADAREPVLEHPVGEELVSDLCDDGPPGAVLAGKAVVVDRLQAMQVIRHQPKERRRLRTSGLVDATRCRGRIGHARSGTEERRVYRRLGCGPSPFRCATCRFDATSVWRGPNGACCCRADRPSTQGEASSGPLATEAGVR